MGACARHRWRRQPPRRFPLAGTVAVAAAVVVAAVSSTLAAPTATAAAAPAAPAAAGNYTPAPAAAALHARLCAANSSRPAYPLGTPAAAVVAAAASVVCDTAVPTVDPCTDFFAYACGGWLHRLRAAAPRARPPAAADGRISRRVGATAAAAAAALMDLLSPVDGAPAADAAAFVHACVDDRGAVGVAPWAAAVAEPAAWAASLQRAAPLAAAAPFLGAAAAGVDTREGWVAALVGLGTLEVFPVYEWRMARDERHQPEDYAAYIYAALPLLTAAELADAGDAGAATLVRTALAFAAPVLGVAADNATVGGVVGVVKRMAAIESTTDQLPDVVRDAQRELTSLSGAGALSRDLLLPHVLRRYGFDLSSRVDGSPLDYPVYLDDPKYLRHDLPAVGLRERGAAAAAAVPPAVVRAYFVFALVIKMYKAGVLTKPVWPDGVRPSSRLFGPAAAPGPPGSAPAPDGAVGGLPPAVDDCVFEMSLRAPRLHDTLDVAFQQAHEDSHAEQVRLLHSVIRAVARGRLRRWLPAVRRGWFSDTTWRHLLIKGRGLAVMVGGVHADAPQVMAVRRLAQDAGGRLIRRANDYPHAWTVAGRVTRSVAADLFRNNRQASRGDVPVFDLQAAAYERSAYYDPSLNLIFLSSVMAEAPYVDAALPRAMAIGAAGSVIAHELMHQLTGAGRKADSYGRPYNWTTPGDERILRRREACYVRKYSQYTPSVFLGPGGGGGGGGGEPPGKVLPLDGEQTLDENIADVEGVRLAWMALEEDPWVGRRRGGRRGGGGGSGSGGRGDADNGDEDDPYGGGVSRGNALLEAAFSPAQLFFLGRAQMMCAAYDRAALVAAQGFSRHATAEYRVQGPLSEMPAFAAAWGCPAATPYTSRRCPTMFF